MNALDINNFGVVAFFILAIVLMLFLRGAHRLLELAQMSRARRTTIDRAWPVAEGLVWLFFIISSIPLVFEDHSTYAPLFLGVFVLGLIWFARAVIGDFVDGVFVRAGQPLRPGDRVIVDGHAGTVKKLGYRALQLETPEGTEVAIPFRRVCRDTIIRQARIEGAARHGFTLACPSVLSAAEAHRRILRSAMDCHWSSIAESPRIELRPDGRFDVTVFAIDRERGADIEKTVRQALDPTTP